jgi:hypothetical protein
MTLADACTLAIDLTRELSATRADRDTWRMLAQASVQRASELARQLEMIDQRQYVHRTRTQDQRDVWLDQQNLRKREAA